MATQDVRIVRSHANVVPTYRWQTDAGEDDIFAGEPVKAAAAGSPYATPLADGDPVEDTDYVVGIAASDSTHTASDDGYVEVFVPLPGVVYEAKANTAANIADTIRGDRVTFDVDGSGNFTVDEDEGDAADHGLLIIDVDEDNDTIQFMIRDRVTVLNY